MSEDELQEGQSVELEAESSEFNIILRRTWTETEWCHPQSAVFESFDLVASCNWWSQLYSPSVQFKLPLWRRMLYRSMLTLPSQKRRSNLNRKWWNKTWCPLQALIICICKIPIIHLLDSWYFKWSENISTYQNRYSSSCQEIVSLLILRLQSTHWRLVRVFVERT